MAHSSAAGLWYPRTNIYEYRTVAQPARANSTSKATKHKASRFRHQRNNSSSSTGRTSVELPNSPSLRPPNWAASGSNPDSPAQDPAAQNQNQAANAPAAPDQTPASPASPTSPTSRAPTSPLSVPSPGTTTDTSGAYVYGYGGYGVGIAAGTGLLSSSPTTPYSRYLSFHDKLATGATASSPPRTKFTAHVATEAKYVAMLSEPEAARQLHSKSIGATGGGGPFSRTESLSSGGTMASSSDPTSVESGVPAARPYVQRNGRTYLNDTTLAYPLPVDLTELHRQSLRTLLLIQVFGRPVCSPSFANKPPAKVLEVGCGSGFWSMMCHRYFAQRGHGSISFTGVDIGPLAPGSAGAPSGANKPDRDMNWNFVRHDMRQTPWPFADGEFDLVMVKDLSMATTNVMQQKLMDEYLRLLRPGGTLEIWESDHSLRMLRPHVPGGSADDDEEHDAAASLGAYVMTANTPLSAPLNNFLVEYNSWILRALEARDLSSVPCTLIGPMLLQESDSLHDVRSRRLAIPLSEARWEREGVGGVVTKDGKTYIETKSKTKEEGPKKSLTAGQAALRRTALLTVVQMMQSLEPLLREVSGKSQDEWDGWLGKTMNDLMQENGTSWGECLEVGAWWAKKRDQ